MKRIKKKGFIKIPNLRSPVTSSTPYKGDTPTFILIKYIANYIKIMTFE